MSVIYHFLRKNIKPNNLGQISLSHLTYLSCRLNLLMLGMQFDADRLKQNCISSLFLYLSSCLAFLAANRSPFRIYLTIYHIPIPTGSIPSTRACPPPSLATPETKTNKCEYNGGVQRWPSNLVEPWLLGETSAWWINLALQPSIRFL